MSNELSLLVITAASVGFIHTVLGPDHYIPFIAMSKTGNWSRFRTLRVTALCGIAHVGSTMILGFAGIVFGYTVLHLRTIEAYRGDIAGWLLIVFGLVYTVWGVRRALLNRPHSHQHIHSDGTMEVHSHEHHGGHQHEEPRSPMGLWVLFTIFIFGPCEPLIPVLIYPAARGSVSDLFIVCLVFSVVTVSTMLSIVFGALYGLSFVPVKRLEQFSHALGGAAILLCGVAIRFLGL